MLSTVMKCHRKNMEVKVDKSQHNADETIPFSVPFQTFYGKQKQGQSNVRSFFQ